ncbi:right-handed parallel beta-helix repeat-containing protein [Aeromicrobium senzhongii]|uniref:Right-handed parallel beta-helix repeat-containing protein n=1 Tax=Aeromicrobium senzhongii TaxID=2663859 RepID=A0ABX6SUY4_9ACTN|nr:right-handed parallel beta-helix repeat-containing protein [Aeromicrobium senzhongii]MTB87992.1 right-handed parallel beta-helix repeat-containing protein [Aeromicrobium senzhongii]QNL94997.1 right-handed parallel beta-helix repeat-containing protein [Aeromicrobium senzhongii]
MRTTRPTATWGALVLVLAGFTAPALGAPANAANSHVRASSSAAHATAILRLSTSRARVSVGTRVTFKVADSSGVKRTVRLQRWNPTKRSWQTVASRKMRASTRITLKAAKGTWRYRAFSPSTAGNSKGNARSLPKALSAAVTVRSGVGTQGTLRLSVAKKKVTPGARVSFRVMNKSKAKRTVRLQRWNASKRSWQTVATRKMRTSSRITIKTPRGTWRYRAMAAKARQRSGKKVRTFPPARSSAVSVTAVAAVAQPAPRARGLGSAPIGSARYAVPSSAIFVAPRGTSSGSGTAQDPYGSLGYALSRARARATLVLRGGRYHENVLVPSSKSGLVIQNYPGEAVWLDGSEKVTNWNSSGKRWVASDWNHLFDHRIMSGSSDETSRWVNADRPLASHPDQVWVNGKGLRQVAAEQAVIAGTFFVDKSAKRIVIGDDPRDRTVEASTLQRAMEIHAKDTTVRGIGVRRYATTNKQSAAVVAGVSGITFENVVVSDNAWIGIAGWAAGQRYRNVTVSGNGIMGFGGNNTNNLVIEKSVFRGNNAQGFKPTPVASGLKITRSANVVLRDNIVADTPYAGGIWFDVSSSNMKIVGNSVSGNAAGLMIELSENAVVADNHIYRNAGTGLRVQASGSIDVWNNTIVENPRPFAAWEDGRTQNVTALAKTIPWRVADVKLRNNVISMTGSNPCPILTQDESQVLQGNNFGISSNNNVFHRPGAATPSNFACWANGIYQVKSFKDLAQFRSGTGNDKKSRLVHGAPVVDRFGRATGAVRSANSSVATPLPAPIATLIGRSTGTKSLGAFSGRN